MANSWAVVVGINHYEHLPQDDEHQLRCAVRDAERIQEFLCQQAGFDSENVVLCTDTSPAISGLNTRPNRTNLRRLLLELHKRPQAKGADMVWFFYSGHGISQDSQDYLLMQDGYPEDLAETAVPLRFVMEKLIECRAKTTVLVLDMCRNSVTSGGKGSEETVGMQTIREAQQQGIITLFSCSRDGRSYELPELGQGVFTYALLEGLGKHTLPGQLGAYLRQRVYELTQHKRPVQVPLIALEPDWKYNLPLLPTCVTKTDINHLKERAIHAFADEDFDLAKQLWEQINDLATNAEDRKLSRQMLLASDRKRLNASRENWVITNVVGNSMSENRVETIGGQPSHQVRSEVPPKTESEYLKSVRQKAIKEAQNFLTSRSRQQINNESNEHTLQLSDDSSSQDDLSSDKGVDYRKLRDLLKAGKWKEADLETWNVICKATNREQQYWLEIENIENFPCADLRTINRLWTRYSEGLFGFSKQKQIWQECGSPTDDSNNSDWDNFGDKVGWRHSDEWNNVSDITFDTSALPGHLPFLGGTYNLGIWLWCLLSRIETCGM